MAKQTAKSKAKPCAQASDRHAEPFPLANACASQQATRGDDSSVYWGDWFLLKLWVVCMSLLVMLHFIDLFKGLVHR